MTIRTASSPVAAVVAGLFALSCSTGPSAEACQQAAVEQAFAEQHWQEEFEQHEQAHEALVEDPQSSAALDEHDHSADSLFSARVDMILAEAEKHRRCG